MKLREVLERVNLPDLIAHECGSDAVRGLNREHGGATRDPRPGHSERSPSFSVYLKNGTWRWKRHGGDNAGGTAYDFLLSLNYTPEQARAELARLAGVSLGPWQLGGERPGYQALDPLREARAALDRCTSLEVEELSRAYALLAPLSLQDVAGRDLQRRGLYGWEGLQVGKLRRDFRTRDGRTLAHAGALAFFLRGPDRKPWGLKVRNLGTADTLQSSGVARYVYPIARHGAPAWCSPGYGAGEAVLIVEGELNGAAAARALEAVGVRLDVQGLAGAGGAPFLHGFHGKPVYLYADPDEAGAACLDRVGKVARAAGAREVRALTALPSGDFCDLAGNEGGEVLGAWLLDLLSTSTIHHTSSPIGEKREGEGRTFSPPHHFSGFGVVVQTAPEELALRKYRAKLRKFGVCCDWPS
ncbi:hypothetical protein [Deinococcus apachensis]|uniref:hypothetical protein n=1 Tax=Deinococcus apachensis TaxID=309886 RepID=UPI00038047C9|nr:hypothetical protein [Deinococcus apachensis]